MFDFAWSEIALIGAVALIAIGPKDMPAAIRTVSSMIKKARRMAAEFQTHVDEMVREADLGDVKKAFTDIRNLDLPSLLEKHVDPDRSIRNTFADDPFKPTYPTAGEVPTLDEVAVADRGGAEPVPEPESEPEVAAEAEKPLAPAFIPPGLVPPPATRAAAMPAEAPAFIPPEAVRQRQT
ncbi:Sec-independent protein translocase protein TatB [Rhodopila sp.]|uniref:Sec-independent protein translocase protein TatB n=1 Tax=Rhodopila sp. TaxID=2480087 RepID=UPI003D11CE6B